MKQYSFLAEAEQLNESKFKSAAAGALSLLGLIGASGAKMPASYVKSNPGATTFGRALVQQMVKSGPKVNYTKEFTRGFRMGIDGMISPQMKATKGLGDAILKTTKGKSSVTKNIIDAAKGNVSL